mgnify:CR=1 FL=1
MQIGADHSFAGIGTKEYALAAAAASGQDGRVVCKHDELWRVDIAGADLADLPPVFAVVVRDEGAAVGANHEHELASGQPAQITFIRI